MITLIEATVISYLTAALETDNVYAERPIDVPEEYYVIERTSSDEVNHIQSVTIAIQSISGVSMLRAAQMNQEVLKAMRNLVTVEDVTGCQLNSAYNFTDTSTKEYRYQAVFDIYYMEGE